MNPTISKNLNRFTLVSQALSIAESPQGIREAKAEVKRASDALLSSIGEVGVLVLDDVSEATLLLRAILSAANGRWISVTCARKNDGPHGKAGDLYSMPIRFGVTAGVKGEIDPAHLRLQDLRCNVLRAYSGQHGVDREAGFRSLNVPGVRKIKVRGREVDVVIRKV
jgi:hypothetical protein